MLAEAARAAPSADNSQNWQFKWDAGRFSCHYRQPPVENPFGAAGHATLLSAGAVAENLYQITGGRCVPRIEDLGGGEPYFSIAVDSSIGDSLSLSHPLFSRHTNRFRYRRNPLPAAMGAAVSEMTEGSARLVLLQDDGGRTAFSRVSLVCGQARFCSRELHEWLMGSLRWEGEAIDEGLDIRSVDLPPGGRYFMRWIRPWGRMERLNELLGLYRVMALAEIQPLRAGPMIACVVGGVDSQDAFHAGRLMERLWIHLNREGLAVHPYYVVSDMTSRLAQGKLDATWGSRVSGVIQSLAGLLHLERSERLHIAFRVGVPERQAVRSGRLALDRLLVGGK
ncbi:hypothetical protein [Parazoarcus communis]|uniref:Nitroreductase domain-containing protein n=1 Tax=Parazoarcus communis SWub3 = DSM 12120 TaxID=1121029 RepID=A0A323UW19_9RHOO|nr:hypothetical protein [Parazoarcus communis]NMG69880.1 hypothetical protein [Parazoarcus communis SWub3 = DSM 12120]PZA16674.1 hypothetical protein DNK49_11250 [Azoarcus communis] [Parazoarcus communis SWub3 = DSM 12120]